MSRQDIATRRLTTSIVLAVGLFAGGDSYAHVLSLARQHGQSVIAAALLPLAGDGLVVAASMVMLVASRAGGSVPLRARVLMIGGLGATVAANVAYGLSGGLTDALLSVWGVFSYVGCMELLTWMRQHLGAPARVTRTAPVRVTSQASGMDASPLPGADADAPLDELSDRRQRKGRESDDELLRRAMAAFPEVAGGGEIPGLRDIKAALKVGQPKQQLVQRHFRSSRQPPGKLAGTTVNTRTKAPASKENSNPPSRFTQLGGLRFPAGGLTGGCLPRGGGREVGSPPRTKPKFPLPIRALGRLPGIS